MKWSKDEEKTLSEIYPIGTDEEIKASVPSRGWPAILSRAGILKLKRDIRQTVIKRELTCLKKFGVENPATLEFIKNKMRDTCQDRYGENSPLENSEVVARRDKTCLVRYGVANVFQSEKIRAIYKTNHLNKYGVENPMQRREVKSKRFKKEYP